MGENPVGRWRGGLRGVTGMQCGWLPVDSQDTAPRFLWPLGGPEGRFVRAASVLAFWSGKLDNFCRGWLIFFGSGAAAGWGRCGGVVRPREGVWEGIFAILSRKVALWSRERREDAGIRLGTVCGGVREACGAMARVSALPRLRNPPKTAGNQGSKGRIPYCALADRKTGNSGFWRFFVIFFDIFEIF